MSTRLAQLLTFSGIDGAGKTTQINCVHAHLLDQGFRVARATFWDDAAFLPRLRAGVSLSFLAKTPSTDGIPLRNDKNVRGWYLMLPRYALYLLDALRLRWVVSRLRSRDYDFIIFDRYLYDQLAQVQSRRWLARAYIHLLLALTPKPTVAFLLDASPDEAFLRKPEYPLAFMHGYRESFLSLRQFVPNLVVISPGEIEAVRESILGHLTPLNAHNCERAVAETLRDLL